MLIVNSFEMIDVSFRGIRVLIPQIKLYDEALSERSGPYAVEEARGVFCFLSELFIRSSFDDPSDPSIDFLEPPLRICDGPAVL